jgi:hypothetical protein
MGKLETNAWNNQLLTLGLEPIRLLMQDKISRWSCVQLQRSS